MKRLLSIAAALLITSGYLMMAATALPECEPENTPELLPTVILTTTSTSATTTTTTTTTTTATTTTTKATTSAKPKATTTVAKSRDGMTYIGNCYVTGYAVTCKHCCGKTDGITKSGVKAEVGRTIAMSKDYPFGTRVYISGLGEYVVEDRGGAITGNKIDVGCNNHSECYAITGYYDAYIIN